MFGTEWVAGENCLSYLMIINSMKKILAVRCEIKIATGGVKNQVLYKHILRKK